MHFKNSSLVLALIIAQPITSACSDSDHDTQSRVKNASAEENLDSERTDFKNDNASSEFTSTKDCIPTTPFPAPSYASPCLVNPVQVTIKNGFTGGTFPQNVKYLAGNVEVALQKIPFQLNPGIKGQLVKKEVEILLDDKVTRIKKLEVVEALHFPYWVDVEVIIEESITITSTIRILGGRNVVVRGLGSGKNKVTITKEMNPAMPKGCEKNDTKCLEGLDARMKEYKTLNTVIALESQQLSATIENLNINVNGDFTDGIGLRQNPEYYRNQAEVDRKRFRGVDVFIRNVTIDGIGGHNKSANHGDMVQLQSGTFRNLFIENFDGTTGYQGLYLPNRPAKSRLLCAESDVSACEKNPSGTVSFIPMEVTGTAYLKNVTIKPYTCANCVRPYIGLYTADTEKGEKLYDVVLQNVTFFRDPGGLQPVYAHIVPLLPKETPEGSVNMSVLNGGKILGRLRIETEKK